MKVRLIACYGVLGHEKEPVYRYCPGVKADHWEAQENVWVEIPDEYISGYTALGELLVNFGDKDYTLLGCVGNDGDTPVLYVPSGRYPVKKIPLRVLSPQETPRETNDSAIARMRIARGMTQKDLAEKMGVTYTQIGNWERGDRVPKLSSIKRLAKALDCEYVELIED